MKYIEILVNGLKQLNIYLTDDMVIQFDKYYELLIEWNNKFNLTAITDEKDVIIKHFIDSLLVVKSIDFDCVNNILDIGTGAGFPGIPLKIIYPEIKLVLLDSVNKKVNFQKEVCKQIALKDTTCLHGRAEDYGHDKDYRESFDIVISRAVSNLSTLSEYCLPFVKVNGLFISYKSVEYKEELINSETAIKLLGGNLKKIDSFTIPNSNIERTYILISKVNKTSDKYPRKAGIPLKNPL